MCQQEEIAASIKEAAEHKKNRPYVKKIVDHTDEKAAKVLALLKSGNWEPPAHEKTRLCEGSHKKERMIDKPVFDDEQIVHHALMRQLRPILQPRFYPYACGSIPDRGPLYAVRAMKRWRDSYGGKKFYVAELDVKKFYQSIDTAILKAMLVKLIRDKRYLEILCRVIDRTAPGLPLGFYTSPWLGNYYLTPLDRHITQTLRPDHYLRYMDNLFLFHKNKKELHRMVAAISEFMGERLHLKMKEDWQVFRFEYQDRKNGKVRGRAINALGYVLHWNRTTMRKSILKRTRAKANRMHRLKRCRRIDAAAMVSYMGWFSHTDTYAFYCRWIKPRVSIQYCKRRISRLSKQEVKKHDRMENST